MRPRLPWGLRGAWQRTAEGAGAGVEGARQGTEAVGIVLTSREATVLWSDSL